MVTIREVAAAAGVSIATVSRSLNGRPGVGEDTRERVVRAAERLDFRPSQAARGLVTGRAETVGVIVPDVTNPFFSAILASIERALRREGIALLLADAQEDPAVEAELARRLPGRVDGVVLVASRMDDAGVRALAAHSPAVLVNRVLEGVDAVAIDPAPGMAEVLTHLVGLGHERVLYLDGPPRSWAGRRKLAAVRAAAGRLRAELVVDGPHRPSFAGGRAAAQAVLDGRFTAVMAYDDLIAWGVVSRLSDLGVWVPDDVSVAGCDDALAEGMVRPSLTTVTGDSARLGDEAAHLLLSRIGDRDLPARQHVIPAAALLRGSTGGAAAFAAAF